MNQVASKVFWEVLHPAVFQLSVSLILMIGVTLNTTKGEPRGTRKRRSAGAPGHARPPGRQGIFSVICFGQCCFTTASFPFTTLKPF